MTFMVSDANKNEGYAHKPASCTFLNRISGGWLDTTHFLAESEALFKQLILQLDALNLDVEGDWSSDVLEIETKEGEHVVVSRHASTHEIWLASQKCRGYFQWAEGEWRETQQQSGFFDMLSTALAQPIAPIPSPPLETAD